MAQPQPTLIRGFEPVDDPAPQTQPQQDPAAAIMMLRMALANLARRTIVAIADLFTLLTVGSVFWLFLTIIHDPNNLQLIGLTLYSTFVLLANFIVRRK